jgi:uncharacterized DUF497 family protein
MSSVIEWDENKRSLCMLKHGIDFVDASEIFATPYLELLGRSELEQRRIAIGILGGVAIAVVFTLRTDVIRIITARKARKNERNQYDAHVSGRHPQVEG